MNGFLSFIGVSNVGTSVMVYSCVMSRLDHFDWLAIYISILALCVGPPILSRIFNKLLGSQHETVVIYNTTSTQLNDSETLLENEVDPYEEPESKKLESSTISDPSSENLDIISTDSTTKGNGTKGSVTIVRTWWDTYTACSFVVLFMLYPTVTKHLFESLRCETVDGISYLAVDL